jgi:2-amino-4-hydroxy-6-hydroxymethyldihydropteridine diphosphokinase
VDRVAIGLGSNLADRSAHLQHAIAQLRRLLTNLKVSGFYETEPVGVGSQPPYLNAAVVADTSRTPRALLAELLAIEQERGRHRPFPGAPRTLDLDLILFGSVVLNEPHLTVPHPRFRERRFVLEPLAEIAPELIDPVTGRSIRELLASLTP